jgi:hypothetical protein
MKTISMNYHLIKKYSMKLKNSLINKMVLVNKFLRSLASFKKDIEILVLILTLHLYKPFMEPEPKKGR